MASEPLQIPIDQLRRAFDVALRHMEASAAAAVEEGKPSPVPYLQVAARLGAKPEDCLVIEDTPYGVESGLRAGMTVWGVNAPAAVDGAHRHFGSLREAVRVVLAFVSGPRPHRLEGSAAAQ